MPRLLGLSANRYQRRGIGSRTESQRQSHRTDTAMFVKKGNHMGLSYNRLRSLVKIAETGSVSAAAIDLNVSQPALSRALNDTERSLGVILFERRGRGVELTEIGHRFCEHAREIIVRYEMIQNNLGEPGGQLTGTASVVFPESVGRMISVPLSARSYLTVSALRSHRHHWFHVPPRSLFGRLSRQPPILLQV